MVLNLVAKHGCIEPGDGYVIACMPDERVEVYVNPVEAFNCYKQAVANDLNLGKSYMHVASLCTTAIFGPVGTTLITAGADPQVGDYLIVDIPVYGKQDGIDAEGEVKFIGEICTRLHCGTIYGNTQFLLPHCNYYPIRRGQTSTWMVSS